MEINKNYYLAIQVKENEKYYAYVKRITSSTNIVPVLQSIKGIVSANIFSKTYAYRCVNDWNAAYKANNIFMFD